MTTQVKFGRSARQFSYFAVPARRSASRDS